MSCGPGADASASDDVDVNVGVDVDVDAGVDAGVDIVTAPLAPWSGAACWLVTP